MITIHHPWVFTFGLLGNVISFMVFLAPLPTFIRIYKKKSTEGFHSIPYVVAIFSAMLWIYYALLKGNTILLITINVIGVVIETIYIAIYLTYAPKQAKISTLRLLLLLNFGGFCGVVLMCHYLVSGAVRVQVFGWICVAVSVSVFIAPLSVMRMVIRTKSVEYMPFNLSFCLTLTATVWFMYGLLLKDLYITLPNVVGFLFGVAQMVLYAFYKHYEKAAEKQKLPEQVKVTASPVNQTTADISPNPITSPPKNHEDVNSPTHPQEIEVEILIHDNPEEDNFVHEFLHGPSTCNVDTEKIVGGPGHAAVQLVQCAV